ncbi:LysE family transporter [Streptomyces spectabilis]|uniref:Arginine exporter protein ArgO n=2 Tax=Streptomyces spectabilis TaxID=68270 RepID=A0A7W8AMW8_STRST|nr:LysE family transporter [Streptomyces spectabilis]MBB5101355.1 arginine exporter protein ArgO [Streptomyces spectabilis]MCI3900552.1 LysE family translocator [Streptomyces spectabilis]GGV10871.1 lysine transporter LysE [Streptomyces spectabilis]
MSGHLVAGLVAGYGIAMPVGAVATYLVALTARTSWRVGACAALGVATADGLYALVATVAGAAAARVVEPVLGPLRWVSAFVLIALAVRAATAAVRQHRAPRTAARRDSGPTSPARAYTTFLGITLLNPATVVYFAALVVGGRSGTGTDHLGQAVFTLAAFAASASWQLLVAGSGALLGRALTGRRGRLVTTLASSAVITGLAVHLLVAS